MLEESTYEILIQLPKTISITPGLQVFTKLISHQHKKLHGPFLWMWSNSLNGSLQKFLVAIWLAWWWKAQSTLESPSGFEHRTLDWESSTITPPLRNYALWTYKEKHKKHGIKFKEWVHQLCYKKYCS